MVLSTKSTANFGDLELLVSVSDAKPEGGEIELMVWCQVMKWCGECQCDSLIALH